MSRLLVFRSVVAGSFLTCVVAAIYSSWAESGFSQDWRDVLEWNGNGGIIPDNSDDLSATGWVFVVALMLWGLVTVVNEVLFFFCWRYSLTIYLWTSLMGIGFTLFFGLSIMSPIEGTLLQASIFLSGIALTLAYCSPIAERFAPLRDVSVAASPDAAPPSGPSDSH